MMIPEGDLVNIKPEVKMKPVDVEDEIEVISVSGSEEPTQRHDPKEQHHAD